MNLKIKINDDVVKTLENVDLTEMLFYYMGEEMYKYFTETFATYINVELVNEDDSEKLAIFEYKKRGTTEIEGITRPSLHCSYQKVSLGLEVNISRMEISEKELRYTSSERNSYKRYKMYPLRTNDNFFKIGYGSLDLSDSELREVRYNWYMFWPIYFEKLSKGYIDLSDVFEKEEEIIEETEENIIEKLEEKDASRELYDILYEYSYNFAKNYVENLKPTKKQITKLKEFIEELKTKETVEEFNDTLKNILLLSPRKRDPLCDTILKYYAQNDSDFTRIIDFETKLMMALEVLASEKGKSLENTNMFKNLDIEVYKATEKQYNEVLNHLSDSYKTRVKSVYRVIPKAQNSKFNDYLKENNIKTVKQFWHGSVNSNWLSIVTNGLKINTKVANGRMFGDGIYFAPDSDKSFGYTSFSGSRWARGSSDEAIMGLYATAYGTPYLPTSWGYNSDYKSIVKNNNCNCLHAKQQTCGLRKDEIIFYDENAVCLNYIVLFN